MSRIWLQKSCVEPSHLRARTVPSTETPDAGSVRGRNKTEDERKRAKGGENSGDLQRLTVTP